MNLQIIASAYGKDNTKNLIENSGLVYLDRNKKRTTKLLRAIGFQMPIALAESGYIGNIAYYRDTVNLYGKPFSDVVSENNVKFSLRENIEETKDLVAVHNMQAREMSTKGTNIKYSNRDWKPVLDKVEWQIVNYVVDNHQGIELTKTADYFYRTKNGKKVFGIYSTDDSTLLYAVHKNRAAMEYEFVRSVLEVLKNENIDSQDARRLDRMLEIVRMQYGRNTGNNGSPVASGGHETDADIYDGKPRGYASAALRNVIENVVEKRRTSGGTGGIKLQERLSVEDRNRLSVLENKEKRLEGELKKLEGDYVKAQDYARAEGIKMLRNAIMSLEHPIATISSRSRKGNPAVVMMLSEKGNNNAPLYAVLSFYSEEPINGKHNKKPHIVLTVSERDYRETEGFDGWDKLIETAINNGKILDYNKKRGDLLVTAQQTRLGSVTAPTLNANLAQFVKEVNTFKEKNKIRYQDRLNVEDQNRLSVLEKKVKRLKGELNKLAGKDLGIKKASERRLFLTHAT